MIVPWITENKKNLYEITIKEKRIPARIPFKNEECPDMSARAIIMKKFICVMKTLPLCLYCSFELLIS